MNEGRSRTPFSILCLLFIICYLQDARVACAIWLTRIVCLLPAEVEWGEWDEECVGCVGLVGGYKMLAIQKNKD